MTTRDLQHFVNAHLVDGRSGRFGEVWNPARGEVQARVPLASAAEVGEAVGAAQAAFPRWAGTTPLRRARVLNRFGTLLEENAGRLAEIITAEHGKVHDDALGEITRGLEVVEFATGIPHLLKGEVTENVGDPGRLALAAPAARGGGGDHALQLPGHGAHVDVPGGARLREHLRAEALGARPVGLAVPGRAAGATPAFPPASSTW